MHEVIKTERGWAGHFIASHKCLFRRNTLLEYKSKKIVVSTVGDMMVNEEAATIGYNRYYETMVFYAKFERPYWEADVKRQIPLIDEIDHYDREADAEANKMHEKMVRIVEEKMLNGEL